MTAPVQWPGDADAAAARAWIDGVAGSNYIGGQLAACPGDRFDVHDPSTGTVLAQVSAGETSAVDNAVEAAREAFERGTWPSLTAADRGAIIWRLGEVLVENATLVATVESLNCGKPIKLTLGRDVPNHRRYLQYFAGWATKLHGRSIPLAPDMHVVTLRQPVGVCGAIVPWNLPLNMAIWKLAPALAAGCTVVLKPSEFTPFSAMLLAELATKAGIPPGVVNVVVGTGDRVGGHLAAHPGVDKIAFTGSTRVGRAILRAAGDSNLKKVSLELGGKSPHVVFADANLAKAVPMVVQGIMSNTGQNCVAGSRLLVQKQAYNQVEDALCAATENLRLGPALDPSTEFGPLNSRPHFDRVSSLVQAGLADGGTLVRGGKAGVGDGYFYEPTIIATESNSVLINQQEVFGPVLATQKFDGVDDAVAAANETTYGLAAGVWSGDPVTVRTFAQRVRAGVVWANGYGTFNPAVPFGGWKESGLGREGGEEALDLYTEVKSVWGVL